MKLEQKQKIDILQVLKDTDRTMYVNEEVAKSAPQYELQKGEKLEFFKLDKYHTCEELNREYISRGLEPASILALCKYDKEHRDDLDEKEYVCSQWKDASGEWCYVTVRRWCGERLVGVSRHGREWIGYWWGVGVRKSELGTASSDLALESKSLDLHSDLESRVTAIENWISNVRNQLL